jgi:hypothetical protein
MFPRSHYSGCSGRNCSRRPSLRGYLDTPFPPSQGSWFGPRPFVEMGSRRGHGLRLAVHGRLRLMAGKFSWATAEIFVHASDTIRQQHQIWAAFLSCWRSGWHCHWRRWQHFRSPHDCRHEFAVKPRVGEGWRDGSQCARMQATIVALYYDGIKRERVFINCVVPSAALDF